MQHFQHQNSNNKNCFSLGEECFKQNNCSSKCHSIKIIQFFKKNKQCSCAVDLPLGQGNPLGYPDLVYTQSLKHVHVVPIFLYTDSQSHMYYANGTSQVFNPNQVSLKNRKGRRHKLLVLIGSFNQVSTEFLLGNFIVYMYYCKSGYMYLHWW